MAYRRPDLVRGVVSLDGGPRLEPHLSGVRCPVRLVVGTAQHGNGIQQREVDLLGRMLTRFTIDTLGDAGHFISEERPDAVVASVRRPESDLTATDSRESGLRK